MLLLQGQAVTHGRKDNVMYSTASDQYGTCYYRKQENVTYGTRFFNKYHGIKLF